MTFEEEYEKFIQHHASTRQGESLRRLLDGHGHGYGEKLLLEKVWWPAFKNFDFLYPEYAVTDMRYGTYYLDYAFIQNFLVAMDWKVIRFSIDEIKENPTRCIQYLQLLLGKYYGVNQPSYMITIQEREVLRLCLKLGKPITIKDITIHLRIHRNTAQALLRKLAEKQWILPLKKDAVRVRAYQADKRKISQLLS